MSFLSLSTVEVQLVMHFLSKREIVSLARCNRQLLGDARSDFAFKYSGDFTITESDRGNLSDNSLLVHCRPLLLLGELPTFLRLHPSLRVRLTEIAILSSTFGDNDIETLRRRILSDAHSSGDLYSLRSLTIGKKELTSDEILSISDLLTSTSIAKLNFNYCDIVDIRELSATLVSLGMGYRGLTALHLRGCGLRERSLVSLLDSLMVNRSIRKLELSHNRISGRGVSILSEVLRTNFVLEKIDLSDTEIGDDIPLLVEGPKNAGSRSSLRRLVLAGNAIEVAGAKALGELISISRSITTLDLSRNRINDEGIIALTQGIREAGSSCTLTELDLSSNFIENDGLSALISVLRPIGYRCSLRTLSVGSNYISNVAMKRFRKLLKRDRSIQTSVFTKWGYRLV